MGLTLAQARTLLRRRLQEPTADQWTNLELDSLLGLAVLDVQTLIQGGDPDANMDEFKENLVAGTRDYAFPAALWWPVEVALLDEDTSEYVDLGPPIGRLEGVDLEAGDTARWSFFGNKVRIHPTPSESVVQGLRFHGVESLALGADGDRLPVPEPLQGLVVLYAEKWARPEAGEATDAVNKEIDRVEARIPNWLRKSGAADRVTADIVKDYS